MTTEELRRHPLGVLAIRSIFIGHEGNTFEETYWLGKCEKGKYFIGFSEDGSYCSRIICEENMLKMINNEKFSSSIASSIYFQEPNLSAWINY